MKINKHLLFLFLLYILIFLPFFINPDILTAKDNDLGRTYIPLFSFFKNSIITYHQIPLWRPSQLMGETFVGNPLSSLFYPPNIFFILFNIKFAAVSYLIFHFILAGISTYLLARYIKISKDASIAASVFYSFSIKMISHAIAGHITMIAAFSYLPLLLLSVSRFFKTKSLKWFILGTLSLSFMYITYPTIFYYSVIFTITLVLYKIFVENEILPVKFLGLILLITASLLLSAIALIPNLEFAPLSTRNSLTLNDVAQPLWSFKKFTSSLIFPYINFKNLNHEELLYVGFVPSVLFVFGFLKLTKVRKLAITVFGIIALSFAAGLSTPLFPLAYKLLPLLKYSRITTRFWFITALIVALTASYALSKIKSKKLTYIAIILFLIESIFISYKKNSDIPQLNFSNDQVYKILKNDNNQFRAYCTSNCFNSQELFNNNIFTANGETPIQHKNSVEYLKIAGNYNYSNYAVIFPPYQIWQVKNPPIPNPQALGFGGIKYIASTYAINSEDYQFLGKFQNIFLYQNKNFHDIARFESNDAKINIKSFSPNKVELTFKPQDKEQYIIYAQNNYPGWQASINGQKVKIENSKYNFQKIKIPPQKDNLTLIYKPKSFTLGLIITLTTIIAFSLISFYKYKKHKIRFF